MKIHPCVWPPDQLEGLCHDVDDGKKKKLVKWQKFEITLCDLTKKAASVEFQQWRFC